VIDRTFHTDLSGRRAEARPGLPHAYPARA